MSERKGYIIREINNKNLSAEQARMIGFGIKENNVIEKYQFEVNKPSNSVDLWGFGRLTTA